MNPDRLRDNRTPMAVRLWPTEDRHGRDVLLVVAKMTWEVSTLGEPRIAWPAAPVRSADVPTSPDRWSSIALPGDLEPEKPGTDVLLVGSAHPATPGTTEQEVSLRIELGARALYKALRVYGPRTWTDAGFGVVPGPAAALTPTPLCYELTYGGREEGDPASGYDPRNPAGSGARADRTTLLGHPTPQIEDPRAPLASRAPAPAGFGPIAASWQPRASFAGTHDATWARERAPVPPVDRDPRFYCCAPADQWLEEPLRGDEPVEILGVTPEGAWRFRLPRHDARFTVVERGLETPYPSHLDTFLIDADARRVELCWRTTVPMPRRFGHLEKVRIEQSPTIEPRLFDELALRIAAARSVR
jgi:hypothetical protein